MLNRKRTRSIMKSKYLMFIPVAALLIVFSNCTSKPSTEAVENPTNEVKEEVKETVDVKFIPTEEKTDKAEVFDVVETMPEFIGGNKSLMSYLSENIKYPKQAEKNGTQGRVIVKFVVQKDGSISDAEVIRGVDPELDAEALRVINEMPKWKPGMQKGKAVAVKFTVPIAFRLK